MLTGSSATPTSAQMIIDESCGLAFAIELTIDELLLTHWVRNNQARIRESVLSIIPLYTLLIKCRSTRLR